MDKGKRNRFEFFPVVVVDKETSRHNHLVFRRIGTHTIQYIEDLNRQPQKVTITGRDQDGNKIVETMEI